MKNKWKVFLEYEPSHTDSIKLLAVTEQTPQAIYLRRVQKNVFFPPLIHFVKQITEAHNGDICMSVKWKQRYLIKYLILARTVLGPLRHFTQIRSKHL